MKKLFFFLITLLPTMMAWAEVGDEFAIDGLKYKVTSEAPKTVELAGYDGEQPSGDLTIPAAVNGYSVTSIRDYAFYGCGGLTSVTIGNSVKSIGQQAFYGCGGLASVTIGNSVTSIGEQAFCECCSLITVMIGNNVTSIGYAAFCSCSSLTSITIGNRVTSIGAWAFCDCSGLISVTIPNSVTSIEDGAFSGCSGLTSVTIPNSVTSIGEQAFRDCSSLISITIPDGVTSIKISTFSGCSGLTTVTIPNSVTSIGDHVFYHCSGLTSVTIPNSVTSIGQQAFYNCSGLTSVTIPNSVTSIGGSAFAYCSGLITVTIPNSMTSMGPGVFSGCKLISSVYISDLSAWCKLNYDSAWGALIPSSYHLYLNGDELEHLSIPDDITSIRSYAFYGCNYLTSIVIPSSVTSIGEGAFGSCSNIKIIALPENLQIIKKTAFKGCRSLTNLTIPASVEVIYQEAFAGCNDLEYVKALPDTPPFLYDNSFTNFTIPLKVPKGCKEAYQMSQGWKNFTNISDADKYKLRYVVDNEEYKSFEIEEGANITPESAPIKEGYTFSGWSKIPETMPAHDVTVTGTFTINSYTLTYMVDGQEFKTASVKYGSTITAEAAPTKEGYTFSGWSEIPETMPAHDVVVTGTFSINSYTLTYMVDGVEYKTASVKYGSKITAEAAPTKEGYTFSGWSEIPETMPAHNVTVTGTFNINSYTLTYMVDGKMYKTVSVKYGATITAETAPTKEGYTFSGWDNIPATMPAHDVTVTGTFTINSYTLTYMVDGQEYKKASVKYGSTITAEAAPTKEGYTFSGWSDIPKTMPAHNVTVTGTFSINSYTLTYLVDGVEYKTTSVKYGSTITAEAEPTKEGYTFSGWSEIPEKMPAHDVTVNGTFSINSYTITYLVDGVEYKTASVKYGSTITAEAAPTKEGYTFSGWSEIPKTMPAHDVTVTGTFTINKYKVTFVVDGQVYGTTEIEYGADVNPIGEPTKEGYTFSGWQNLPEDMPAHDITVTGTFTVNQYKVTFKYGKNVLTTIEVDYGAVIPLPESLNSERFTLIEWLDVPKTMPARDIIIYADYVDGIDTITADSKDVQYIQINGMYTNELKQGLNIIRMSDGTTKKVWVK